MALEAVVYELSVSDPAQVDERNFLQFPSGKAQQGLCSIIVEFADPVLINEDGVTGVFHEESIFFLGFLKGLLGFFPLGDFVFQVDV